MQQNKHQSRYDSRRKPYLAYRLYTCRGYVVKQATRTELTVQHVLFLDLPQQLAYRAEGRGLGQTSPPLR